MDMKGGYCAIRTVKKKSVETGRSGDKKIQSIKVMRKVGLRVEIR